MTTDPLTPFRCRACGGGEFKTVLDLGHQPLANSYLESLEMERPEPTFPLRTVLCEACRLVQLDHSVSAKDVFSDYAYLSSFSESWVAHAHDFSAHAIDRFTLGRDSLVVEIASNDGYLLQHFVAQGVPVLGVEPAANIAVIAREKGIPTDNCFFNPEAARRLVDDGNRPDLIVGNNVLAHVPDLVGFVKALAILADPKTVISIEAPHLLKLITKNEFDTIYHEHYSYFSLEAIENCFGAHGLRVFDVTELPTHGGSLRVFACQAGADMTTTANVADVRAKETEAGLGGSEPFEAFAARVDGIRSDLVAFLRAAKASGKTVAAYGAAAKGNTLLNYCGVGSDLLAFVVDRNPLKQDLFLPGSHVPILAPEQVFERKPDYLLVLPWNLIDEIREQMRGIGDWGGKFVVPVPEVAVLP